MSTRSADGGPSNGRTGNATRQTRPSADDDGRLVGPIADAVRPGGSLRAMALNLSALAATIVILTAGVALAGALIWPKTYTARAEVLYPITQEQPTGFLREDRSLTTQLVLIRSRPILDPIAAQQGRDVVDLQKDITATVLESSEIIQLEVKDRSAERAVQTAQAVLAGYLEFSRSGQPTQRGRIETGLAAVTTALADAQKAFDTQQAQVTVGKATADTLASLQRTVQAQQLRQQHLQTQLDSMQLAPVAQQLTAPYPTDVVYPQPLIVTATGALLGLLLAACVVVVVARGWMRG